jgi:hypothetical protein
MPYDLPPDERARLHKVETVLIIFFSTIILAAVFGVVYSKIRPLPPVKGAPGRPAASATPGNASPVTPPPVAR